LVQPVKHFSKYLLPILGAAALGVGAVSSSRASAMDDTVALDVRADGDACRAVVGAGGRDVLCASAGRTVVGLRPQPRDLACPNGGRAISWGSDINGSGLLDPSELEGSTYVCAHPRATSGTKALVMQTPLPLRDGHCPAGGVLVQSGIDRDDDGVLSSGEIDRATWACNRFGGPSLEATVAVTDTPPGETCAHGGKRIQVGHEGEAGRVSYVCDAR
jgi:hypothetical protein